MIATAPAHPAPRLGQPVLRRVWVGGLGKPDLLARLQAAGIQMNEAGRTLFADDRFNCLAQAQQRETLEDSVAGWGFAQGALLSQIIARAAQCGLVPCALALGPWLRLQTLDQAEGSVGQPASSGRAPPGSLTLVSEPEPEPDLDRPQGFYIRKIEGVPWLRGYRAGPDHVWRPEDRLLFCRPDPSSA